MPSQELKRIFQTGRMNLDLDDRLVPNGEYRYALNVNIGRSEGADIGAVENLLGNELLFNVSQPNAECIGVYRDNGNERIYFFVTTNDSVSESNPENAFHGIFEYDQSEATTTRLAFGSWLNFHKNFQITGINLIDTLLFWTDNRNEPRKINIDVARASDSAYNGDELAAVIKLHPLNAPTITNVSVNARRDAQGNDIVSQFLERRLIRFAYRYKFRDGEYSTISPFSTTCFDPRGANTETGFALPTRDLSRSGEVLEFVNRIQQISIDVPVPSGNDIIEVELIWKEQARPTIYILETRETQGGRTEGFTYTGQDPFRALPGSQLTRVNDAVPRLAQSQEIAGGRIVYGNFLHQFNLPPIDFSVSVRRGASVRPDVPAGQTWQFPFHSVKSRRTYQIGIVLVDRFGRQTPVILSSEGTDTITVDPVRGTADDALTTLAIQFSDPQSVRDQAPWAVGYKVYVKQREQEYYNVFTTGGDDHARLGDTINKVPVDTTQATSGDNVASTAQLYPKILAATNAPNPDPALRTTGLLTIEGIDTGENTFTVADQDASNDSTVYELSLIHI